MAGLAEELQPFSIVLPLIVAKKLHHSRKAIQSFCIIETCLKHCLYCFIEHKSWTPQKKSQNAQSDTLIRKHIFSFYYYQTYICTCTHTHSHTPLRAGDNCLAVYAPTIVRLPGQREPGMEEGRVKEQAMSGTTEWVQGELDRCHGGRVAQWGKGRCWLKKGGAADNSKTVGKKKMEKTSRFQQMTRPTQKTGERRRPGRTKAQERGEGGGHTAKERIWKQGREKNSRQSVKREWEQNKP